MFVIGIYNKYCNVIKGIGKSDLALISYFVKMALCKNCKCTHPLQGCHFFQNKIKLVANSMAYNDTKYVVFDDECLWNIIMRGQTNERPSTFIEYLELAAFLLALIQV